MIGECRLIHGRVVEEAMATNNNIQALFPRGIVIFHEWLIGPGGAERLAIEEYRHLRATGIATHFLSFEVRSRALYGLDVSEIEIIPRKNLVDGIRRLRTRLAELNPDLVIVAAGYRDFYLASRFLRIPYIVHQHEGPYKLCLTDHLVLLPAIHRRAVEEIRQSVYGYRFPPVPPDTPSIPRRARSEILSWLDWFIFRGAGAVTVLSNRVSEEVSVLYGREAVSLRGCLPREIFTYQPRLSLKQILGFNQQRLILSISRLHPLKRIDVVIRAFAKVATIYNDVRLVIGGIGPAEKDLKNLVEDLGLQQKVVFLGFVPDDELWDYMATCDIFVCADWTDFDIAPYEALAFGRRIVWSSEMETDEALTRSGYVFAPDPTAEGFADGIVSALQATGQNAFRLHDYLEQYTWDSYVAGVLQLASQVVSVKD
jgi:glycosyltransferase involved in cell wall biosynthesis